MPRDEDEYDDNRPRRRRPRDDDEYDRPRRRSRRRTEEEDDYDDRPSRPPAKQVSILGVISLVKGIGALIASFMPCIGTIAILPGALGLFLGIIGLVIAKKSRGRQGSGLPIAGICVSSAAIVIALIQIAILGAFTGGTAVVREQEAAEVQAAADVPSVTAVQLDREFDTNELKAEADYKGKVVEVTGTIKTIVRDRPGVVVVELKGTPDSTIDCEFRKDAEGQLAGRNLGDQITIRGKCKGRVRGWVTLESCMVATPAAKAAAKAAQVVDAGGAIKVTAAQFVKAYHDDEARADRVYKDKVLELTGTVREVSLEPGPGDTYEVLLRVGADEAAGCEFALTPENRARLARLKPGDKVTIRGKCLGAVPTIWACVFIE